MFEVIRPAHSGITFSNNLIENDTLNVMDFYYIYNGAGLGIGDFNNDGLKDVYFSGNQVSNQLYLNRDGLRFEDVTAEAGVGAVDIWGQGVALIDINNGLTISNSFVVDENCGDGTGSIDITTAGGSGPLSFNWSNGYR